MWSVAMCGAVIRAIERAIVFMPELLTYHNVLGKKKNTNAEPNYIAIFIKCVNQ